MSLTFFTTKEEETTTKESINNYKNIFEPYTKQIPSLKDALEQMFNLPEYQMIKWKN